MINKGYFSGDGSIYLAENGKFKIEAATISDKLANDLMYLLLDFGIVATCYKNLLNTNNSNFRVSILGVKNFERFSDIGFIDQRNNRINQYIESRKWSRSDLIPLSKLIPPHKIIRLLCWMVAGSVPASMEPNTYGVAYDTAEVL